MVGYKTIATLFIVQYKSLCCFCEPLPISANMGECDIGMNHPMGDLIFAIKTV